MRGWECRAGKLVVADVRVTGNRLASDVATASTKPVSCVARDHRATIELSLPRRAASCPSNRTHRIKSYPDMTWGNNARWTRCVASAALGDKGRGRRTRADVVGGRRRAFYWRCSATDGDGQIRLTAAWHSRHWLDTLQLSRLRVLAVKQISWRARPAYSNVDV